MNWKFRRRKMTASMRDVETEMCEAAKKFEFERVAKLRDTIKELGEKKFLFG